MKDKELKPIANVVGAFIGRPLFEEITKNTPTPNLNPNTKHQTLTSNVAITLIALVITIIVMLILVGVTVSVAINGGLFSTAKKAVTKTEEAKDSELRFVAMANAATHDKLWTYTSKDGKTIPIPAGFAPTEIEGETSTEDGFVIIDAEGNEFVWIPCDDVNEYNNATFENDSDWSKYQTGYLDKTWTDGEEEVEVNGKQKKVSEIKSESVNTNKGFYVARYEAGVPEEIESFSGSQEEYIYYLGKEKKTDKYKPVSKRDYPAWNFISQTNAKTVSENMYSGMSYLIDSHAWNYICEDILREKKDITNSTDWGNYVNTSVTKYENLDVLYAVHELQYSPWEWQRYAEGTGISGTNAKYHKGSIPKDVMKARTETGTSKLIELATGASEDFKGYNIYDMAGNMWECTTETSNSFVALRGASFRLSGTLFPVVFEYGNIVASDYNVDIGFRVVLYL